MLVFLLAFSYPVGNSKGGISGGERSALGLIMLDAELVAEMAILSLIALETCIGYFTGCCSKSNLRLTV